MKNDPIKTPKMIDKLWETTQCIEDGRLSAQGFRSIKIQGQLITLDTDWRLAYHLEREIKDYMNGMPIAEFYKGITGEPLPENYAFSFQFAGYTFIVTKYQP